MTYRIYLTAAQVVHGRPGDADVAVERVFINAADVAEVWVETESASPPEPGKAATFALRRDLGLGFTRIGGTVERRVSK